ncbi:MAG: hypothetical protein PHW76_04895 [Alphaproteobacteria bacterium]|nr:hypothetical protein [Alphaproteobacteria bacterium]
MFNANVDVDVFYQWTVQDLLPKLSPASVVVMDNASFHKRSDIRSAISNAGHTLEYLCSHCVSRPSLYQFSHFAQSEALGNITITGRNTPNYASSCFHSASRRQKGPSAALARGL